MTTNPDLNQAREWAKDPSYQGDVPSVAAAHVIASLPDEWIDADKLREFIDEWEQLGLAEGADEVLDDLRRLLPTPTPRTLADMTPEEREACQWMQARLGDSDVILTKVTDTYAAYVYRSGTTGIRTCTWFDQITPLPDLPRMVWPDEQATEEDMSIIPPEIDTSTGHDDDVDMTPEDVPEEEPWIVECYGDRHVGTRDSQESPHWALARMDGTDVTFAGDHLVTLVSRLVPEEERA